MAKGAELFVRTMIARAYPRVIGATRERSWLFFETVMPLLSTAAYVFFYRAINAPEEYVGLVVVGGAMTAYWLNVLWSMSSQLYWDKDAGNLSLYIAAPGSMMAILLGMAAGGLIMTTTRAAIIILGGWLLFGVDFSLAYWALLILAFAITMAALYGMGMLFASLFLLFGREAWHLSNLLQEPIYLFSGFYFPVSQLAPVDNGGGLTHPADARAGCHAPASVSGQSDFWLFGRGRRNRSAGGAGHSVHRLEQVRPGVHGAAGDARGPADGEEALGERGCS